MRNRFGNGRRTGNPHRIWFQVLFFAALFLFFFFIVGQMGNSVQGEKLRSTEQAVRRATVHCYAVEGHYPSSLAYLESHYGLLIDKERYVVHYEPIAANLMPKISVFPLTELESPAKEPNKDQSVITSDTDLPGVDFSGLLEDDAI